MSSDRPPTAGLDLAEASVLDIRRLADPRLEAAGFDVRSAYMERFWLPVLGPASVMAMRHLNAGLAVRPRGYRIEVEELARSLGLGGTGRNSPVRRTLHRLVSFDMAAVRGSDLLVRTHVAALSVRHRAACRPPCRGPMSCSWSTWPKGRPSYGILRASELVRSSTLGRS